MLEKEIGTNSRRKGCIDPGVGHLERVGLRQGVVCTDSRYTSGLDTRRCLYEITICKRTRVYSRGQVRAKKRAGV